MTTHTIRRAFVLLSGGMDSTTCLYKAIADFGVSNVEAVSLYYGQRHRKELDYARRTCVYVGVPHTVQNIGDVLGASMLTDESVPLPDKSYAELEAGVSPTYVPFRNGTLLSVITAHAQRWVNEQLKVNDELIPMSDVDPQAAVYFGAHAEDAHNFAYPDCTPEFIGAMANAIYIGTYHRVRLHTPLMWLFKHEIVDLGYDLGVNFADTWSCYAGGDKHCGTCPTCRARKAAFANASGFNRIDPTLYAA